MKYNPALTELVPPQAPSQVSAVVDYIDKKTKRAHLTVTWMDNCDFADEFNTHGAFYNDDGTQGTFNADAVDYDKPKGSTGMRTSQSAIAVPVGLLKLSIAASRRVDMGVGFYHLTGPSSETIEVLVEKETGKPDK